MEQPFIPDDPGIDPDYDAIEFEPRGNGVVALCAIVFIGLVLAAIIGIGTLVLTS